MGKAVLRDILKRKRSGLETGNSAAYVTLDTQERKAVRRATTSLEAESQTGSRPSAHTAAISGSVASSGSDDPFDRIVQSITSGA
jgi:hypothetical protein